MITTLFIKTSMTENTEKGSISSFALDKYKELYMSKYKTHTIKELNLNNEPALQVAMSSNNFEEFFKDSDKYIDLLKSVDQVVISVPMTNFSYTAQMKNFFDKICVAGKTFQYKYNGKGASEGLLKNLHVQVIATQGAEEGWYEFSNFVPAMEGTWKFLGAKVKETILISGNKTKENGSKTPKEIINENLDKIEEGMF